FFRLGRPLADPGPSRRLRAVHAGYPCIHPGPPMKLELPEHKKLVYETRIAIRWGDMDAMGHLNNATYFRYLETARIDWMRAIGCSIDAKSEGFLIINAFCNFHKQLEYPGDALVKMYASDLGRSSFESW